MKISEEKKSYEEVMKIAPWPHKKPRKQSAWARWLLKTLSAPELKKVDFSYQEQGMEQLGSKEPALYLMNHSCFLDLQIAATYLKDRPYHIVCTNDGMVGKEALMRWIGCIPTKKFITDVRLVKDMLHVIKKYNSSVLMFPEASYSFDGTQTPLPDSLGKCIKLMQIPVVLIQTKGAFLRDPLYNALQLRNVKVSATMKYFLSPNRIREMSADEINEALQKAFQYDHFREQARHKICVDEPFRGDGLERVLYKCSQCGSEEHMRGQGTTIRCEKCGNTHELTEYGELVCLNGQAGFSFVPDWYQWQRECVRREIQEGRYHLDIKVRIRMLVDAKKIYEVGEGRLTHSMQGFDLEGCHGQLQFHLSPTASYSLYADYFWYEIGDMICIGDNRAQYYCFPLEHCNVAKARLATEELYRIKRDFQRKSWYDTRVNDEM